jgi:hypothetical protein
VQPKRRQSSFSFVSPLRLVAAFKTPKKLPYSPEAAGAPYCA